MPHLKALVERHKDAPFALIGINTGDSQKAYNKGVMDYGVTWPCVFQGRKTAVADLYRVKGYPTIYVLDAEGKIRHTNLRGRQLEAAVDKLVAQTAQASK
jgi:thiol-disulfide isomerase/thioredoxin